MNYHPRLPRPRAPLTLDEVKRRKEALELSTKAGEQHLEPTPRADGAPRYAQGVESCIRTIYGADPEKRAEVFQMMAREAVRYTRSAGMEVTKLIDRLQETAVAIDLVETHGQDQVQGWLADACSATEATSVYGLKLGCGLIKPEP